MNKPLINPDYILAGDFTVTVTHAGASGGSCGPIVTDADLEWIEEHVGMGAGGWDTISPKEIVEIAWQRFVMKMKGEAPL